MSSTTTPITPERFALAITDLPLSNLYAKAAEIRNSIAHLQHSNQQLAPDAERGDRDCAEALRENVEVMERMRERLALLRFEVQRRGSAWEEMVGDEDDGGGGGGDDGGDKMDVDGVENGVATGHGAGSVNGVQHSTNAQGATGASANPGEADMLALLQARLRENDEHGLHL